MAGENNILLKESGASALESYAGNLFSLAKA